MQKVVVIGCPGAGKTEFSKQLASRTGLPLVHLDRLYHDASKDYKLNRAAWRAAVQQEIAKARWIIDGNYKSTFDIRLPTADTIIFLDYPTYVCVFRAVRRRWQLRHGGRADMPDTWKERLGWRFVWFIVRFNSREAPRIRTLLAGYRPSKEVLMFRRPTAAHTYLNRFKTAD